VSTGRMIRDIRPAPLAALLLAAALACVSARADDAPAPGALRDLCVDRPGKATSACTVDAGHVQLEADIFNGTFQSSNRTYIYANPTIKFGLSDDIDLEANFVPFVEVRTKDQATGATTTVTGVGDLFLRAKFDILGNGVGDFALVLEPYVKIPTARDTIGNGALEGGLLVPLALDVGNGWSLSATPELDILKNANDGGRHVALSNVIGIGRALGDGVSLTAEFWGLIDFDSAADTQQYSFDLAAAWQPSDEPDLQFDAGVNFSLNAATPDRQVYAGVSRRF